MDRPLRNLLVVALLALSPSFAAAGEPSSSVAKPVELKTLSIGQVSELLEKRENVHVYDNNGFERYAAGHLPGAVWLKFDAVEAGNLPVDKAATLVFYCANELCRACHIAATSAVELGYRNVFIMPAGIMGWEKAGRPVEKGGRRPS